MNKLFITTLAVTLSFLFACAHSKSDIKNTGDKQANKLDASQYFPMKVGAYWQYDVKRGSDSIVRIYKIIKFQQGEFIDSQGAHLSADILGVHDQSRYFLRSNVPEGFAWWAQLDYKRRQNLKFISASETVKVPAGTFTNCILIEAKMKLPGAHKWIERTWYAKGVGVVKRTIIVSGNRGELILHEESNLAKFNIP